MEKKIRNCMKKKGLLNPTDIVIDPPFIKEVMEYPNSGKCKSSPIDPYAKPRTLLIMSRRFSLIHYMGALDAIMCQAFLTTFHLAT